MARATAPALWLCGPGPATDPLRDPGNRTGDPGHSSDPDACRAGHQVCCSPTGTRLGRHTKMLNAKYAMSNWTRMGGSGISSVLVTRSELG